MYVIGIDGGGTRTTGVLVNPYGEIKAKYTVGASNPNLIEKSVLQKELLTLIMALQRQHPHAFTQVKKIFAAMSGVNHPNQKREMKDLIDSVLPTAIPVHVDHDAIAALYAGTFGAPGVVQIAGTGSITYGINDKGEQDRVGGWGHFVDERGSGFSLGSAGLKVAFQAYDRQMSRTMLQKQFMDYFNVTSLPDLIQLIYRTSNPKEVIAALGHLVIQTADLKDVTAQQIIWENGHYMGESIVCLIKKLFKSSYREREITVVFSGGLFNRFDVFREPIEEMMQKHDLKTRFIIPNIDPVGGAVIAAFKKEKITIHNCFTSVFKQGMDGT